MRNPALRRAILEGVFWQMPKRLDRTRAGQITGSVRWCITGGPDGRTDTYQVELADGRARIIRGDRGGDAKVTITLDGGEFLRLATGNSDAMQAYFKGRIEILNTEQRPQIVRPQQNGRKAAAGA